MTFVTVVKIAGIDWFNRMEVGVKEFADATGIKASLVGPDTADAAKQIPIIEDLIAQKVDALCVIPMDPAQLDPVLKKAMDAGIPVITHEGTNQKEHGLGHRSLRQHGLRRRPHGPPGGVDGRRGRICRLRGQPRLHDPQRVGRRRHQPAVGEVPEHEDGRRQERDL